MYSQNKKSPSKPQKQYYVGAVSKLTKEVVGRLEVQVVLNISCILRLASDSGCYPQY